MAKLNKLQEIAKKYEEKLKKIKVFVTDVDGVLTNGQVYYAGEDIGFNRFFHIWDGYGMVLLRRHGLKIGFITGGESISVEKRAEILKVDYLFMGNEDKRGAFLEIVKEGYNFDEILYIGDDLFDIPLLKKAGFSATVAGAPDEVSSVVDYITERVAGRGAVREVVDLVRYAQGIIPDVKDFDE